MADHLSLREGSAVVGNSKDVAETMNVNVSVGIFNVRTGTCADQCVNCMGFCDFFILPNPFSVAVSGSGPMTATAVYSNGTQYDKTRIATWTSSNTALATVDSSGGASTGTVTGEDVGDPTITSCTTLLGGRQQCMLTLFCRAETPFCDAEPVPITPHIDSISPAQGGIGTNVDVTISGQGFGSTPTVNAGSNISVTINSATDSQIQARLAISSSAPLGNQSVTVTVAGHTSNSVNFLLNCGDERDQIRQEYVTYAVLLTPLCPDFTRTRGSVYFSFTQINTGDYTWALIRGPLIASASSGYGLDAWRTNYGGPRIINSAYRNPARNAAVGGAAQSRHMYGDAADLRNQSGTMAEWQAMVDAAVAANRDFVEPLSGPCGLACVHADWRNHSGGYQ